MHDYEKRLTPRDRRILKFLSRYRAATDLHIATCCFEGTDNIGNVQRVLRRLASRGLLKCIRCGDELMYYVLTRRGFTVLDMRPRTLRSLTEHSLPVVLAVTSYCSTHGLERLTHHELRELFPELWQPGLRSSSYVLSGSDDDVKLEMLLVDRGGTPRRIRSRIRRILHQRSGMPKFVSLINGGCFRLTVLTGTPEQQTKIENQIQRESFEPVEVRTVLVIELASLLLLRRK